LKKPQQPLEDKKSGRKVAPTRLEPVGKRHHVSVHREGRSTEPNISYY